MSLQDMYLPFPEEERKQKLNDLPVGWSGTRRTQQRENLDHSALAGSWENWRHIPSRDQIIKDFACLMRSLDFNLWTMPSE